MKDVIIYHKVDLDGVASAAIVVDYLKTKGREYELIGWTYGDPIPELGSGVFKVWILDVSFGENHEKICGKWNMDCLEVIWIDHHKTAIPEHLMEEQGIEGIRRIGTAACELTWEYLYGPDDYCYELIRYLSAYDVWNKERFDWNDVMAIQYATRARVGLNVDNMVHLIEAIGDSSVSIISEGKAILNFLASKNKGECANYSFEGGINGYNVIFMNTLEFNSTTFDSVYNEDKHDMMCPFAILPNGLVKFSLYSTKDWVDCGETAKLFGGGGHKGAAGFQINVESQRFISFMSKHRLKSPNAVKVEEYQKLFGLLDEELESFELFLKDEKESCFDILHNNGKIYKNEDGSMYGIIVKNGVFSYVIM